MPVFLGLGAIFSLVAAGLTLAAPAAFFAEGFALDLVFRAAALAEPGLTDGADAGFFSAGLAAGTEADLATLGAAALGAGAGVLADAAGFGTLLVDAALGAGAGVLAVLFFSAGLDPLEAANHRIKDDQNITSTCCQYKLENINTCKLGCRITMHGFTSCSYYKGTGDCNILHCNIHIYNMF